MGRGGAVYVSYTALVLLSVIVPASADLWDVDIDLDPAPSAEDGPPFSANATRNRDYLPYQIIGVVASYLGTVFIVGLLLLTIGRRLRRRAQEMTDRPREMIKPTAGVFGVSPISPPNKWMGSVRSKKSTASSLRSRSNLGSPGGMESPIVDQDVVDRDKQRAVEDMARFYEAFYREEEHKNERAISTTEVHKSHPGPPALTLSRPDLQRVQSSETVAAQSPLSPTTPTYYAVHPPKYSHIPLKPAHQNAPLSPASAQSPQQARAPSFGSNRTTDFTVGQPQTRQTLRKSIRNLKISAPIQRLRDEDNEDDARTPLSPGFYTDPGSPPERPTTRTLESQGYPVTPGSTVTGDFVGDYSADVEDLDQIRDLPRAYPQRGVPTTRLQGPESPERRNGHNATNANPVLPFRQMNQEAKEARHAQNYPLSPGRWQPMSAGPLKTTFVDAPRTHLGAPMTGIPTPYSPYMPGGLVTPITPSILSRDQRKQKRKEERAARGVITEEDQVADEKDLWDYGY